MIVQRMFLAAVLLSTMVATPVLAHVTLAEPMAKPGATYVGRFRVSHGCDASPTVRLRIEIPEIVTSAKPQPKPGWKLTVEHAKLATPLKGEGGASITERISAVTWEGSLDAEQFDEFAVMLRLPAVSGLLYFPTVQTCAKGENRWVQIPEPGDAWNSVPRPAPVLDVHDMKDGMAMDGMAGMDHSGH